MTAKDLKDVSFSQMVSGHQWSVAQTSLQEAVWVQVSLRQLLGQVPDDHQCPADADRLRGLPTGLYRLRERGQHFGRFAKVGHFELA